MGAMVILSFAAGGSGAGGSADSRFARCAGAARLAKCVSSLARALRWYTEGLTALETRTGVLAGAMVGRHRERRRLVDAMHETATGGPRVVVIGGDAGVGKTCLMDHFTGDAADAGALVLTGACVAFGGDGLPLAPITAALRGLVRQLGTAALPAELAFLVPELASPGAPA